MSKNKGMERGWLGSAKINSAILGAHLPFPRGCATFATSGRHLLRQGEKAERVAVSANLQRLRFAARSMPA